MKASTLEMRSPDAGERRALEQTRNAKRAQVNLAQEKGRQTENELWKAELALASFDLKQIAEKLRAGEQRLKDAIPWYIPVEELLDMPLIGVQADDFESAVGRRAGMRVEAPGGKWMALKVASRFKRPASYHWGTGALMFFDILADGTLRPTMVLGYQDLFTDPQSLFEAVDTSLTRIDIGFIGRSQRERYGLEQQIHETMVLDRKNELGHPQRGCVEVYDWNGERQSLRNYERDHSDKLR